MKSRKRQLIKGLEKPNQEKVRMLEQISKYLRIIEADTIKQAEMKEEIKKNNSKERMIFSKPNYTEEISSKGYTYIRGRSWNGREKNLNK